PDQPAPVGAQLEPEVARALPSRSRDGRTYTFTIRPGFRFSPPASEEVTAETFRFTIERSLSPRIRGPALGPLAGPAATPTAVLENVVGAHAYMTGRAEHISGVVAHGDTLSIRLLRPAPDLPARLALPFFCAVP